MSFRFWLQNCLGNDSPESMCNIMAKGFRFMPLGLVRHRLLRCNIKAGVHACIRVADVSPRDVTIAEMRPALGEDGWFSLAHGDLCGGCQCVGEGGRWKSQNRKIVPLSLCRRTFKLKGNKKVHTWTEKSLCVFRISRSYVFCIYLMNVPCTFRIFMYMAMVHMEKLETNKFHNITGRLSPIIIWEIIIW